MMVRVLPILNHYTMFKRSVFNHNSLYSPLIPFFFSPLLSYIFYIYSSTHTHTHTHMHTYYISIYVCIHLYLLCLPPPLSLHAAYRNVVHFITLFKSNIYAERKE
ncbi:hypothetical protein BD560DRAFT_365516 [Blakeslea trispora]|nr:hypothetical protein BD560DRAFT_365516 [Blakeslea trispora]